MRGLFPGREPFWAGFGNKAWDTQTYKVGARYKVVAYTTYKVGDRYKVVACTTYKVGAKHKVMCYTTYKVTTRYWDTR